MSSKAPQGVLSGSMSCSLQPLLLLTMNLSSGENSSEGAHLLLSSSVFREHNQNVTNLGSISLSVYGDPNPQMTAPRLALVWLGLSSWLAEANPL